MAEQDEQLNVVTLWGVRRGCEDQDPELLAAWDEATLIGNPEGCDDERADMLASCSDELLECREITVQVPKAEVTNALESAVVSGRMAE